MTTENPTELPRLSALELERHVSVAEAAQLRGVSPWTFRRHFPQLIRKQTTRRSTVKLRDLLAAEIAK